MLLQKFLAVSLILLIEHPFVAAVLPSKPAVNPFQSIKIFPSQVVLGSRRSTQRIVVQGYYADGYSEDITAKAKVVIGNAKIAKVASGVVAPLANGSTVVSATLGSLSASAPVSAANIDETPKWSFRNHVI